MRFIVSRTSLYGEDKPCEGVYRTTVARYDVRVCKTFAEFDEKLGDQFGPWLSQGTEHKVLPGRGISRRTGDEEVWAIDIHSLDQLVAFYREHGDLVLQGYLFNADAPALEIYDTWRE